jgi:hypothetical protein
VRRQLYVTYAPCVIVIEKFVKKLWGKRKDKIQAALERLDRLTKDEGLSAVAQTLGVVHGISRAVMGGGPYFRDFLQIFI